MSLSRASVPTVLALVVALVFGLTACAGAGADQGDVKKKPKATGNVVTGKGLPRAPRWWPKSVALGVQAEPDGSGAPSTATVAAPVRYHYLSGGVRPGQRGWATWHTGGGSWAPLFADSTRAAGQIPVFSYYQLLQSSKKTTGEEGARDIAALQDKATMAAYYADLRLFFQRVAGRSPVVLHVEPDLWGYLQVASKGDDASTVSAQVSATGVPELAGLPNDARGFSQAVQRLRDRYARNVRLGYHLSSYGTGKDIQLSHPSPSETDTMGRRSAAFLKSLRTNWDVVFAEFANHDHGYRQTVDRDRGAAVWRPVDFDRFTRYLGDVVRASRLRVILWQIPLGNSRMRSMNNTDGHYQDNRVESLLGAGKSAKRRLLGFANNGVIGILFGRAHTTDTCACDAKRDGITNPPPINRNSVVATSADDDGGYFASRARIYVRGGGIRLRR